MKSFVHLHRAAHRYLPSSLLLIAVSLPSIGQAQGLPTVEDPSRGPGAGILDTIQNYSYDIVLLVALLVISTMFIGVCYHGYVSYSEIQTGRKTWGEFGLTVAVGAVLLVIAIWLLTTGTEIL